MGCICNIMFGACLVVVILLILFFSYTLIQRDLPAGPFVLDGLASDSMAELVL